MERTARSEATSRILIIGSYGPSLMNFRGPLIAELIARGHSVAVTAPEVDIATRQRLEALGAQVIEVPLGRTGLNPVSDLKYLCALRSAIRLTRAEIILTYTIKPNIWGAFAARAEGVRSVAMITGLGIVFTDTGKADRLKSRLLKMLISRLYRRASNHNGLLVFQNPDDAADFESAGCLTDPSKVRFMNGSGVDLTHFRSVPLSKAPNFLMISRILGAKGVREYAYAAIAVKKTHPEARFRLVGFFDKGPDSVSNSEFKEWVEGGLEFLGASDDVRSDLAACRIYVLPSYREGTPRSVLEAMAAGRPIITTDAPGCRETVQDGVNGYLVPVRDSEALAARMRDMIDDPARTAEMGEESLRIAREKYDVRKVNKQLMGYLGLLDAEAPEG